MKTHELMSLSFRICIRELCLVLNPDFKRKIFTEDGTQSKKLTFDVSAARGRMLPISPSLGHMFCHFQDGDQSHC